MKIKNIFWDVDGVLANLNYAYYYFLTNHPNYKEIYKDMKWEDLPSVLPVHKKYGALELKTHPTLGEQMDKDFCNDYSFFANRPLYPDVIETLWELDKLGYKQLTMSATFNVEVKQKLLNTILADVSDFLAIECVQHGKFMHDNAKEAMLKFCLEKYDLKAEETVLVDDRIYNLQSAINVGIKPIRLRSEFTTNSPPEYSKVPEFKNVIDFKNWLFSYNS